MARCLALLGMAATHVLDPRTASGDLSLGHAVASGRASALFAVLAGVSIALVTGRRQPVAGRDRARASAALVVRALLVAMVGLTLAEVDSGIAVILAYYGVMFLLALPFLGLSARWLLALGGTWAVAAPILSHWLRPHLPERGFPSPSWGQLLDDPAGLLSELAFTGYYPAVPWLAYLLVGMAVGRLDLTSRRTAIALTVAGVVGAVLATVGSHWLTDLADTSEALPGNVPTGGTWEWLLVIAPHSTTPFDLVQTIGSALGVIGVLLLGLGATRGTVTHAVAILFGAGTMTLTLYSLHVVLRSPTLVPDGLRESYPFHVLVLVGIGAVFAAARRRGPLERLVGAASHRIAGGPRLVP